MDAKPDEEEDVTLVPVSEGVLVRKDRAAFVSPVDDKPPPKLKLIHGFWRKVG